MNSDRKVGMALARDDSRRIPLLCAGAALLGCLTVDAGAMAPGPSFLCDKIAPDSVEAMICADAGLSALDRRLSGVHSAVRRKAGDGAFKAEQYGWIEGRNACSNSEDRHRCVEDAYRLRIADLQARYRLVRPSGSARFTCGGDPMKVLAATFFATDPPTLVAEYGEATSVMYQQQSGSGTHYQGRNESFREHQGEARLTWGPGAPEMLCRKAP
jgi:uncharacterized protein